MTPLALLTIYLLLALLCTWERPTRDRLALTACIAALLINACASVRPQIQAARDDFVLACRELTAAMVGDGTPSKAERIAQKVCLVERMGETIEHEIVADGTELFAPDPPPVLAPASLAPQPIAPEAAKP